MLIAGIVLGVIGVVVLLRSLYVVLHARTGKLEPAKASRAETSAKQGAWVGGGCCLIAALLILLQVA